MDKVQELNHSVTVKEGNGAFYSSTIIDGNISVELTDVNYTFVPKARLLLVVGMIIQRPRTMK